MSINFNPISSNSFRKPMQDPDAYAQQYASQKGISLEEAKEELKSKFGDPTQGANIPNLDNNQASVFGSNNVDASSNIGSSQSIFSNSSLQGPSNSFGLSGVSSSSSSMKANPDDYAQQYADENNISLEEAKEELKKKYGAPKLDFYA